MTSDEIDLIHGLKAGSKTCFEALYNRWVSQLYHFVFHYLKSEEITDDIVQDTFVRIWNNRESLDPSLSFKSYLFTISYHSLLKELDRQLKNPLMNDYIEYEEQLRSSDNETQNLLEFDQFQKALKEAKQKLTPRQREIFEMNKECGIKVAEIALRLSISEQVVRNQLSTALKVLRTEMKSYYTIFLLYLFHI